ncbi:flagellar hook-associated protein FlgL [compost metagenome]
MKDLNLNISELDSKTEDADMADTIMKLKTDENVYQASLSVGAKLIQPSLLDYLR